ncbi:hypothetical protein C8Q79DRAFT_177871 [Trametes meyenii]|nr:hypothetical protein C8Q79DRAFT_177871 [Trametes meyenii]
MRSKSARVLTAPTLSWHVRGHVSTESRRVSTPSPYHSREIALVVSRPAQAANLATTPSAASLHDYQLTRVPNESGCRVHHSQHTTNPYSGPVAQIGSPATRDNCLHYLRNGHSVINRLPPEILYVIFIAYSETYPFGWKELAFVCWHLRDFTLVTPGLWRTVHVHTTISWLDLCLQRSQDATLDIVFHKSDGDFLRDGLRTLLPHSNRLRSLVFEEALPVYLLESALQPLFENQMIMPEHLKLPRVPEIAGLDVVGQTTYPNISHWCHPRLHSLMLNDFPLPMDIPLVLNLRKLSLNASPTNFKCDEFIRTLSASRQFEELYLEDFWVGSPN